MLKNTLLMIMLCVLSGKSFAISVERGNLITMSGVESKYVAPRDVHIWLPEGYAEQASAGEKFAVLYMHDGQMLFDGTTTWNKQEWGVDEVASAMLDEGLLRNFIVVGINNGGEDLRHVEYFPQKPFEQLKQVPVEKLYPQMPEQTPFVVGVAEVFSDNYLKFIVEELKPKIDQTYYVHTDLANTMMMGSSMGGLISLYAISEYPEVFGAAACISTHWPGAFNPPDNPVPDAFFAYMRASLPDPASHRLYFDHGTETLDAQYSTYQKLANTIISERGYTGENWQSRVFHGAAHDEESWNARLRLPLTFLLGKQE